MTNVNTLTQILVSGLTLGAMYAISTVSLSLIWGALNMLNMAQGAFLTFGGYVAYAAMASAGMPSLAAIAASIAFGALLGVLIYGGVVRRMLGSENFEVNIIIATVGIISFVGSWNNYLLPLYVLNSQANFTLPLGVQVFSSQYSTDTAKVLAFTSLAMLPALVFFSVFEKRIVGGLTGAVKG